MASRPTDYHCALEPHWVDYNGHLRDAYYTLVFSQAVDALMDEVGIDQPYRAATACTLFTLELHLHYLNEIKASDTISVRSRVLGVDAKRIHLGLALSCPRLAEPAALGEFMLLHVRQGPATKSAEFPAAIRQRLADWQALDAQLPLPALGSRKMQLPVR